MVLGFWLLFSPYLLNYSVAVAAQQTVLGILIITVADFRFSLPTIRWPSWINVILSIELLILPLDIALGDTVTYPNMVITGLVILGLSIWSGSLHPFFAHHMTHGSRRLHSNM